MESDEELADIEVKYRNGNLSTAELKTKCITVVSEIVQSVQDVMNYFFGFNLKRRKTITEEILGNAMDPKYPRM